MSGPYERPLHKWEKAMNTTPEPSREGRATPAGAAPEQSASVAQDGLVERLQKLDAMKRSHPSPGAFGQMVGEELYRLVASGSTFAVLYEAADALTAQQAEIAELKRQLAEAHEGWVKDQMNHNALFVAEHERAERAEAALKELKDRAESKT